MSSFFRMSFRDNLPILILSFSLSLQVIAAESPKSEPPLGVIVQTVSQQDIHNSIQALGNLKANESIQLTAKVAKMVTQINFDDGQRVSKGALLLQMTNGEESALMEEAKLNADEARKQLERVQALSKTGAVSPALLDQRTREYEAAYARYLAVQARLNDLIIRAPFAGVIGLRNVSLGGFVSPGQNIATLNDDSKMKLDFTVPSISMRSLKTGLAIEAKSRDLGDKLFYGKVITIDNQIDEATRSVKVRAILDNAKHELKQGLMMAVTLHSDSRKALVVSEAALVPMASNNFVFVLRKPKPEEQKSVDKENIEWFAEKRQVEIGERFKGYVEIVSGISIGEKVVTHGLQKIRPNQGLKIISEQNSNPTEKPTTLAEMLDKKSKSSNNSSAKKSEGK